MPALYNWLVKKYYKQFNLIICQAESMQHDLVKYYQIDVTKTVIIHNAVHTAFGNVAKPDTETATNGYKFVTVARLREQKGIERLIHAVGLLSVPFKYYIIGEGGKRNELQKLIDDLQLNDKVILAGQKNNPFSGMEDADLFLMGSYYEGFPNVLLEAGAHGIPVVAFNVPGGIAEIITTNENGLLVAENDIIAFAAAINKAITAGFDRNKIIETTKNRFSVNMMIRAIENLFLKQGENK